MDAGFENEEIAFYQMNGFVFGTWLRSKLAEDMALDNLQRPSSFALAHNFGSPDEADAAIAELLVAGGKLLRKADAPPHGGYRGYVADPDGNAWEIAHNPAWQIDDKGLVTFGV
jgi:uncharacterized glyoxalase superfamily protein PhnB